MRQVLSVLPGMGKGAPPGQVTGPHGPKGCGPRGKSRQVHKGIADVEGTQRTG